MTEMSLFGSVHNVTFYVDCKESLEFTGGDQVEEKRDDVRLSLLLLPCTRISMGLYDIV